MAVTPTRFLNRQSDLSEMTLDQFLLIHGSQPVIKQVPQRQLGQPLSVQDRATSSPDGRTRFENPDNEPYIPPDGYAHAREEIRQLAIQSAREIMAKKKTKQRGLSPPAASPAFPTLQPDPRLRSAAPNADPLSGYPPSLPSLPTNGSVPPVPSPNGRPARPAPGRAHVLVSPTPTDTPPEIDMQTPCEHVLELVFEVEGLPGQPVHQTVTVAYPLACEVLGVHRNQPHMMKVYGRAADPSHPDQDVFVGWGDVLPDQQP